MPDATVNHTPAGWPYLDDDNFIDIVDEYTEELALKLENSEADVAAAINAAQQAQTAAASIAASSAQLAALNADKLLIGGVEYQRSGSWAQQTISAPSFTSGVINCFTVTKTLPYAPPAGWTFTVDQRFSSGWSTVGTGSITPGSPGTVGVRVVNMNASSFEIRLGWQLVKV